ncbi:MAG: hypothetical protein MMC33_007990 [Icmadophila ericetorum]|nr:hypothetical protein [Icmadophila ericetorum]
MTLVRGATRIPLPEVYDYAKRGSDWAEKIGAPFILLEVIYGNTLFDKCRKALFDTAQWAAIQAELATSTFDKIGGLFADPVFGTTTMGSTASEFAGKMGLFIDSVDLLTICAKEMNKAACEKTAKQNARDSDEFWQSSWSLYLRLECLLRQTCMPDSPESVRKIQGWELAQAAPCFATHFDWPFPPRVAEDLDERRNDPDHSEPKNTAISTPLKVPLNEAITSDASTIFYLMGMHGLSLTPDEENLYAMVRIAFGMNKEDAKKYFRAKEQEMLSTDAALEQASKRETEEVTCDHITELNNARPKQPFFFLKPPSSILPPKSGPVLRPKGVKLHYEVELGVIIGRQLTDFDEGDEKGALDAIDGYCLAIDMTARNVQDEAKKKGLPWSIAKGFDTFCPISDYIPKSAIPDPHDAELYLHVNGKTRQDDSTALMLFRIPRMLRDISKVMTLEKGDLVLTGTPKGVGSVEVGDVMKAGIRVGGKELEQGIEVEVAEKGGLYEFSET